MADSPRQGGGSDANPEDYQRELDERREARRERRRLANLSPGEGRNSRQPAIGEDAPTTPTRPRAQRPRDNAAGPNSPGAAPSGQQQPTQQQQQQQDDMSRYGLTAPDAPGPADSPYRPRRRMSASSPDGSEAGDVPPGTRLRDLGRTSQDSEGSSAGGRRRQSAGPRARRSSTSKEVLRGPVAGGAGPRAKPTSAEVHVLGEIVGASGFSFPELFCRWQLVYEPSKSWTVLRGQQQGATQACTSEVDEEDMVVWEHPLDVQMQTQSLQGWPALLLMVYSREDNGRDSFVSYALVPLPNTPGSHKITAKTWFAVEGNNALGRRFFEWFTGLIPRLEDETFITDLRKREDAGPFINTVGAGDVYLRVHMMFKGLEHVVHQGGESLAAALERLTTNVLRASTQLANRSAAVEEHRSLEGPGLSEGQRLLREGRSDRFSTARAALDAKRRDQASPAPSDSSRGSQAERAAYARHGSRARASEAGPHYGGADDGRSEASQDDTPGAAAAMPPKDRYAARSARRTPDRTAQASDPNTDTSAAGSQAGAPPQQAAVAVPTAARSGEGQATTPPAASRSRSARAGAAAPASNEIEEVAGGGDAGQGGSGGQLVGSSSRAAERSARRSAARTAF